jgi:hypothetical protein
MPWLVLVGLCRQIQMGGLRLAVLLQLTLTIIPKEERKAFSMSDIKTLNHNRLLLCRFFDVFGIDPNKHKNKEYIKELKYYGTIAA